jgi:hypothetical protein
MRQDYGGELNREIPAVRNELFEKYKNMVDLNHIGTVPITFDNIDEVKVALTSNSIKVKNAISPKWVFFTFKVLPPHMFASNFDTAFAKNFFDEVRKQRDYKPNYPQLSWWFVSEIANSYLDKITGVSKATDGGPASSDKLSPKSKEEHKNEIIQSPTTKPGTNAKENQEPLVDQQIQELIH